MGYKEELEKWKGTGIKTSKIPKAKGLQVSTDQN